MLTAFKLYTQPDLNNNRIPEAELPVRPTVNEADVVRNSNEIPLLRGGANTGEEHPSNVLMSHAADDNIFNRTEVLAGQWTPHAPPTSSLCSAHLL